MAIIDVQGVAESDGEVFKLLPTGIYPAEITGVEVKEITRAESKYHGAHYLNFSFKAEDPDSGIAVTIFDMIMLPCSAMDSESQRKSRAKIKSLEIATGLEDMGDSIDTDLFLHTNLKLEVSIKSDKQYGNQNVVKHYLSA